MTTELVVNTRRGVLEKLKCCMCNLYLSCGPVRCNSEGKGICGRCMPKEDAGTIVRNLSYETAMENTRFPCIYNEYGCKQLLLFNTVVMHESNCLYKPISCISLEDCEWTGTAHSIFDHFAFQHKDLIMENYTYKVDVKNDIYKNLLTIIDDLVMLFHFVYISADQVLYVDGVHFADKNVEVFCKVSLINAADYDYFLSQKPFKCGPFNTKEVNLKKAQKISFATTLPALQNPDAVLLKIALTVNRKCDFLERIDAMSMEQLKCSKCFNYMVPPIVTHDGLNYCQNCYPNGLINNKLETYAKQARYPCLWSKCPFVGTYENIRLHETDCQFAPISCPLSSGCLAVRNKIADHLECQHSCKWFHNNITLDYYSTVSTNKYYCWIGEQMGVLYLAENRDMYNRVIGSELRFCVIFPFDGDFVVKYYFCHSHCKMTSVPVCTTVNFTNGKYSIGIPIQKPNLPPCFTNKKYSIKIEIQEAQN